MCIEIIIFMYTQIDIHVHVSLLYQLKGPRSNDIPVAVSIPNNQILVLLFSYKRNQDSWRKADSKIVANNIQQMAGASFSATN